MKKHMKKNVVALGIVALFIGLATISSSSAHINVATQKTLQNTVDNDEGKPDLTITNMWLEGNDRSCAYLGNVKNIGEATFNGYAKVKIKATINIVLHRKRTTSAGRAEGLEPGDSVQIWAMQFRHPKVFIHFDIEVNPEHTVNESNYDNNQYHKGYVAIGRQLFPRH